MNDLLLTDELRIENMIYEVRGKQVMLDSDLAKLYECVNGTKSINLAVNRHIERFPEDFYFQLTKEEYKNLKFQSGTSRHGGTRRNPHAFTEQGVAMLASVLRTSVAAEVSVQIMRAFVLMKKYISASLMELQPIHHLVLEHEERLALIEETFSSFKEKNNHLFFEGQIYDAYSLLIDIFHKAKEEIIIIDNYIDKNILDLLSTIDKKVVIITNQYNNQDYHKYKLQYKNTRIQLDNTFHDRFIILDQKILYHSGASFKDLGKKCFAISRINDRDVLTKLLKKIAQEE